jgi:hypothetical protein
MKFPTLLVAVSLSLSFYCSAAFAMASSPDVVLPEGVLNAQQIELLVQDKTVATSVEDGNREELFYFGKDGKLQRVLDGLQSTGRWNIREDGRLCTQLQGKGRDCRIVVKQGQTYRQYVVKKDGNHRYDLTYTQISEGQQLAKLSKVPILPAGTLKGKKIVELFSGQTVESVTAVKGRVSQTYYNPDGTLQQRREGTMRYGTWRVTKNSRMCLKMEDLAEKCRIIVNENGAIKKYIVKKNGRHQHSVSYRNFTPGKNFK